MIRQRGNRSDWEDFTKKRKQAELDGAGDIYGAVRRCSTCNVELKAVPDGGCLAASCPYAEKPAPVARARPVQVEQQHAARLAAWAYRHWWYPGWTAIEHRTAHWREADQRSKSGVKTGLPDYVLMIPPRIYYSDEPGATVDTWPGIAVTRPTPATLCALELKAPHLAPVKDPGPDWWLDDIGDAASRHGVRREQVLWLRTMAGCGFRTKVAYGADQALAWLVEQAGPRPDVLPEGWE